MTLADLGSLGEFIGSIAVLVTLVFLAFQVRQNTKTIAAATHQSILDLQQPLWCMQADFDYADRLVDTLAKEELSEADRLALGSIAVLRCRAHQNIFHQVRSGALTSSETNLRQLAANVVVNPVVLRFWGSEAPELWPGVRLVNLLSPDYVTYLDRIMKSNHKSVV